MARDKQTLIQTRAATVAAGPAHQKQGILRRVGRGGGARIGASLALALLLVLAPSQTRLAHAQCSLGSQDTATGTGALASECGGNFNTADGYFALQLNTTGSDNTALGYEAGVVGQTRFANKTGSNNTFLGYESGPGTSSEVDNATAIGANALVSESNALVLGAPGVKVGIGTASRNSLLQVGVPSTSYGSYLQIPMVTTRSTPAASDCNASTFVGRLVLQFDATKVRTTLWSCSAAGVWTRLAQGG